MVVYLIDAIQDELACSEGFVLSEKIERVQSAFEESRGWHIEDRTREILAASPAGIKYSGVPATGKSALACAQTRATIEVDSRHHRYIDALTLAMHHEYDKTFKHLREKFGNIKELVRLEADHEKQKARRLHVVRTRTFLGPQRNNSGRAR